MHGMAAAEAAVLFELELLGGVTFVLGGGIISAFAGHTPQSDNISHRFYLLYKNSKRR